ncbi:biotin--[acetyl-CoA-carboxylase] ligase [Flavobacterium sp.]|uniref:biotin--[acetyl-CoA-carboxylase] ligase n=1 Tax=Flavobacterium sp. TaxID=239 RepID=UPI001211A3AC|nr:biotin--[acetyl-CoA-carboxylase] ligase [Flavobacterium sp.]RZJ69704.1 MAG: biotin--[acetyl-CoA-carboxylase] ligase [Flavobacterium sp.]
MRLIKLDAIGSTNDYLKDLAKAENLSEFTIVTAETQTAGRGQRGATWIVEPGKNLTMSVFVKVQMSETTQLFALNAAVALTILEVLKTFGIPELSLKWPNDIMSGRTKVGGILIENSVKTDNSVASVIGIGLNVNQTDFEGLPNASSLALVSGVFFEKDEICIHIASALEKRLEVFEKTSQKIWSDYQQNLFRKGKPTLFQDLSGDKFMGIIANATKEGLLEIKLGDDSIKSFGIKEVTMLY